VPRWAARPAVASHRERLLLAVAVAAAKNSLSGH